MGHQIEDRIRERVFLVVAAVIGAVGAGIMIVDMVRSSMAPVLAALK